MRRLPCAFLFAFSIVAPVLLLIAPSAQAAETMINVTSAAKKENMVVNGDCTLGGALASVSSTSAVVTETIQSATL